MAGNKNLHAAKSAKNDEFYTRLSDISEELKHYKHHFKDKVVLCNCDDPYESNFFKYFALNFNHLGLKELIATCYAGSPVAGSEYQLELPGFTEPSGLPGARPHIARIKKVYDATGDGAVCMDDIRKLFEIGENSIEVLQGDGDFRSPECLAVLDEADIVCTNPPFSLFREYVTLLNEHGKSYVIMGNKNAITYKEFFPLLKDNKVWIGATPLNGGRWMIMPKDVKIQSAKAKIDEHGQTVLNVPGVCWFTNLDIKKRHEPLICVKRYEGHEDEYPMYDNYAAINVDKVKDIPEDYMGVMGVPITFIDKYCPEQFEILNCNDYRIVDSATSDAKSAERERERERSLPGLLNNPKDTRINGKSKYARILIRRR